MLRSSKTLENPLENPLAIPLETPFANPLENSFEQSLWNVFGGTKRAKKVCLQSLSADPIDKGRSRPRGERKEEGGREAEQS